MSTYEHGTRRSYKNGCKCAECRRANADYETSRSHKVGLRLGPKGSPKKHGGDPAHPLFPHRYTGYILGCRCTVCTEANRSARRKFVARADEQFFLKQAAYQAAWSRGPGRVSQKASKAAYKARLKAWMSDTRNMAEISLIRLIYAHCPVGYHVDHIVPLSRGGWHNADNLQYLPAAVNMNKKAKLVYDVTGHVIRWQDILGSNLQRSSREGVGASAPKCVGP